MPLMPLAPLALLTPFKQSAAFTMGVELELQLVSLSDYDLIPASPDMLELLNREAFPGTVTPEMTESMIEIATNPHTNYTSLRDELRQIRDKLLAAGSRLNVGVCGGGTHPFQQWSEQRIYKKERFEHVSALYGYLSKQFTIFGQHVHIGCENPDDALFLLHALSGYIPHFIALSGSSPYVQGHDTLFDSARLNSVFAFPLSGRAPFVLSWQAFEEEYFKKMAHTGVVKSMKDFYWDIRPKPEYGTIELRVCDCPLTVDRAAAIAAYFQTLCKYLLDTRSITPSEDDYLVYNYNRFQACRFGLDGVIIDPKTYEQLSISEDILETLTSISLQTEQLGSAEAMLHIRQLLANGNDATQLRHTLAEKNSMGAIVNQALTMFKA